MKVTRTFSIDIGVLASLERLSKKNDTSLSEQASLLLAKSLKELGYEVKKIENAENN